MLPETPVAKNGFALVCDEWGVVQQIIHDALGLDRLAVGQPLGKQVHPADWIKLHNFLGELRHQQAIFNWEVNFASGEEIRTLYLSGSVVDGGLIVVGTGTESSTLQILDELMQINNEQATTLRMAVKDQMQASTAQKKVDYSMFEEISRLNNELVTLQRDLAKKNAELERLYHQVHALSMTDTMTGVYNRRGLYMKGEQEIHRAKRYQRPLAAILFDIDHFKKVNDAHGHLAGDAVIIAIAKRVQAQLRKPDILSRYGGDEFVILLPETPLEDALLTAERIRTVARQEVDTSKGVLVTSLSLGVAMLQENMPDLDGLLQCADQALYQAKNQGRDNAFASIC